MADVTVQCDRCQKVIKGAEFPSVGMTAGYYDTTGSTWGKYANPGERIVCDDCMWNDERYQADYGKPLPKVAEDK